MCVAQRGISNLTSRCASRATAMMLESLHTSLQQQPQLHVKDSSEGVGVGVSKAGSLGMQHLLHFH
jgi:hypothetical protein